MFEGRIRRALDYADRPFELRTVSRGGKTTGDKVFGLSEKIGFQLAGDYAAFEKGKRIYLSCGDSSQTDIPDQSVDTILTDPPFFDNVYYSQLADFFYVWQQHILGFNGHWEVGSTRSSGEVQSGDVATFTDRLSGVWREACRVLKNDGLLGFTYHHSRPEGWQSVLKALMRAGFGITAVQPIKAEMSVAMPKHLAKEPIDLDIIVVCRKRSQLRLHRWNGDLWGNVRSPAIEQVLRLRAVDRRLSRNDIRIIVMAQLLRQLSISETIEEALGYLETSDTDVEALIESLYSGADNTKNRD